MATNTEAQFFSREAVDAVLRGHHGLGEIYSLRGHLGAYHRGLTRRTLCTPEQAEMDYQIYHGLCEWWLAQLASHRPAWRGGYLRVAPVPKGALDFYLDVICAEYTRL